MLRPHIVQFETQSTGRDGTHYDNDDDDGDDDGDDDDVDDIDGGGDIGEDDHPIVSILLKPQ